MKIKDSEYINYRLSRAKESYNEAQLLAKNNYWNTCVNRLYYSCYYAVSALLYKHNINTKTHSGLNTEFGKHFIKTGEISKEHGGLLTDLMDWRHKGDYGDSFNFDKEKVDPLFKPVKKFLKEVELLINTDKSKK